MSKIRVYELAKELNTSSSRLLTKLADLGVQKNNHMSYIEEDELRKLYNDLGINKSDSQKAEKQAGNSEAKRPEGKGVVKVTTVYEPTKGKSEQASRVNEAGQKDTNASNANKNTMSRNAGTNTAGNANRNRQQPKDRTGSGRQTKGNRYNDKKRESAPSGLLGDMKVMTDDDRMRMLKEKARRLKMQQEKLAEQSKKEAERADSSKDNSNVRNEKKDAGYEKELPIIKVTKISPESKPESAKKEEGSIRKDADRALKEGKVVQKQEQASLSDSDKEAVERVQKLETAQQEEPLKTEQTVQKIEKIDEQTKQPEPNAAAQTVEDKQEKTVQLEKQAIETGETQEKAKREQSQGKTFSGEQRRENRGADKKTTASGAQIKYPAKTEEQIKSMNATKEQNRTQGGTKSQSRDFAGYKDKDAQYGDDSRPYQKKGPSDSRKYYDKKDVQDYATGKSAGPRGKFGSRDSGKDKKELEIPKADARGKEEIKTKNTGERRNYLAKDTEKLDKREQKKGAEKPVATVAKPGTAKKNRYKQPDFIVGQKKGVNEILSDDFILDEFYSKDSEFDKRTKRLNKKQRNSPPPPPREVLKHVVLPEEMTVKTFSEKIKKTSGEVILKLMELGIIANLNQTIDFETAFLISEEFGITADKEVVVTAEDILFDDSDDHDENLVPRPPVVVVMGHVDHGKTSLLDAIKKTNVIAGEAGGITQHIGAYMVQINGREITFLDTPGHEAFTSMRARGAQVTDIAILVVAADDGVMPQTVEAINHAKAAGVSIIVAINKIDSPNANPEKVKQELTEYGLVAEEWGGDTICVPVSALKNENIDALLEMVLLTADVLELKADPNKQAKGTIIESRLDRTVGAIATLLVQRGTLKLGDSIVTGATVGRIRQMKNDKGQEIQIAGPSTPVEITGLHEVPVAGNEFYAIEDEKLAKQLAEERREKMRESSIGNVNTAVTLEDLFSQIQEGNVKELNIIIKADVHGSVEAVKQSLEKLSNEEVKIKIIHGAVGTINESDVQLAAVSGAIIIGFNVRPGINVIEMAETMKVDVRLYRIIYDAIEDIEAAMKGMLDPTYKEEVTGHVEIRQIFKVSGIGSIAGCYVIDGKVVRTDNVRLVRDGIVIYEGKLASLKRFKDDVREVTKGYECGLSLENYNDIKEGDIVEVYVMKEVEK